MQGERLAVLYCRCGNNTDLGMITVGPAGLGLIKEGNQVNMAQFGIAFLLFAWG